MNGTISLDFIGGLLRQIQSEQRTLRMEIELLRREQGRMVTRELLAEVVDALAGRIGASEALMETRFDQLRAETDGLRSEMGGLRSEMDGLRSEIDGLRSELTKRFDQLDARLERLQP
jgi:chromosome segregation ATPase